MGVVLSLLILGLFVLQQKLTSRPSFSLIRALLDIYSGLGVLAVLGFELRVLCLLGRCSTS
jgi:hypothetical protein